MEVEIAGTSSASQAPSVTPLISYGTDPGFIPNDDKLVDVWLSLRGAGYTKTVQEEHLYNLLTNSLIKRVEKYGSLERA
jgi:hypothetical protein